MIEMCNIQEGMKVLDPSKGGGVFYDNFPNNCIKDDCEIDGGKDFLNNNKKYDLILVILLILYGINGWNIQ